MKKRNKFECFIFISIIMISYCLLFFNANDVIASAEIKIDKLRDGVLHHYRVIKNDNLNKPWFFKQMENLFNVILPKKDKLPFGKSVAFLVGVSEYDHIRPQLPFVKNDLKIFKNFLFDQAGFDEIYIASEKIVNRDLIEKYMFHYFKKNLNNEDRFLFYYSGHGGDLDVESGYMFFSGAKKDGYEPGQILSMDECYKWNRRIRTKHILFLFDCCMSGLSFSSKKGTGDSSKKILSSLSGNGSRTVITAGNAKEEAIGIKGNSVFTKAFIDSLKNLSEKKNNFITLNQIFAETEISVKKIAQSVSKTMTPRRWELESSEYTGTFLFINNDIKNHQLSKKLTKALKAKSKGVETTEVGKIHITSFIDGNLYINREYKAYMESGDVLEFIQDVGEYSIEIRNGEKKYEHDISVSKGATAPVIFEKPIQKKN